MTRTSWNVEPGLVRLLSVIVCVCSAELDVLRGCPELDRIEKISGKRKQQECQVLFEGNHFRRKCCKDCINGLNMEP